MWFLALTVVLSATPRHLAVAPRDSDAAIGDLERAVRDALRVALPGDRIDTADDLTAAAKAQIDFAHPTAADVATLCDLGCAFGRDGLVTAERLQFGSNVRLHLAYFRPGNPIPVAEVIVPMGQNAPAATAAVQQLVAKL